MKIALTILFAFVLPLLAADYHVSPSGLDTNDGTLAAPFKTAQKGVSVAQPGDSVILGAGVYPEIVKTVRAGTTGLPITVDGKGKAIIKSFQFKHAWIRLTAAIVMGATAQSGLVEFHANGHNGRLDNCTLDAGYIKSTYGIVWRPGPLKPFDPTTASYCLIENNAMVRCQATAFLSMMGAKNVFRWNSVTDGDTVDFVRLWGEDNLISGNRFERNIATPGLGWHPDFIQTFGNGGDGSRNHVIEKNVVNGIVGGQLTQLEGNLIPEIGNWTFRNNVFANIALQASCSIPNVRYEHNVFYRCNTVNGGSALNFGSRTYTNGVQGWTGPTGTNRSNGSSVVGNVFLECGDPLNWSKGWYAFGVELTGVSADYNYVAKPGFKPVREDLLKRVIGDPRGWDFQKFYEPNGRNGGDPLFKDVNALDFTPIPPTGGSFLIGAGPSGSAIGLAK